MRNAGRSGHSSSKASVRSCLIALLAGVLGVIIIGYLLFLSIPEGFFD